MERYHVNPTTGRVGRCQAKKKCRFHLSPEEHFSTPEAAQEAYASGQSTLPRPLTQPIIPRRQLTALKEAYGKLAQGLPQAEASYTALYEKLSTVQDLLSLARFEALEAAEERSLWRQGEREEAVLRRMAYSLAQPLITAAYQRGRKRTFPSGGDRQGERLFSELSSYYLASPEDAYSEDEGILAQEEVTAPAGSAWPQPEDNARQISYAHGRVATVRACLLDQSGEQFLRGPNGEPSAWEQASQAMASGGNRLTSLLARHGGTPPADTYREALYAEEVEACYGGVPVGEDFLLIGAGIDYNAYLERSTGLVYKRANSLNRRISRSSSEEGYGSSQQEGAAYLQRTEQEAYGMVKVDALAKEGLEYCPTYFLEGEGLGGERSYLMVQPYLDLQEWTPIDLGSLEEDLWQEGQVSDLHDGNCRLEKATGRVVIIDGLAPTVF